MIRNIFFVSHCFCHRCGRIDLSGGMAEILKQVLGSDSIATAIILATFLGGLSTFRFVESLSASWSIKL